MATVENMKKDMNVMMTTVENIKKETSGKFQSSRVFYFP
jgi:hypothetical protein